MKKAYLILSLVLWFSLFGCYYDDDGRFISLQTQDAFVFENNENYSIGDTLYIELNFSRYLDEDGFSNKLDVFESSGNETLGYDLGLIDFTELPNGGFQGSTARIDPEALFAEKGIVDDLGRISVKLNMEMALYESRIGLILREAGRFEFNSRSLIFLQNNGPNAQDKIRITLLNSFSDPEPNFEFTVSE